MLRLVFPPKCILCNKLLSRQESDLCHTCREKAPEFRRAKSRIPFVAQWTALWYYKDDVRSSIHRYKFGHARNCADPYARLLAVKLQNTPAKQADVLTWVPISPLRQFQRGYDQSALLAEALGKELSLPETRTLRKIRHTPPQSGIRDAARRRANVLGAYRAVKPEAFQGKTVLLVDDVVTTGATASECAKTLLTAGAEKVLFVALAATQNDN